MIEEGACEACRLAPASESVEEADGDLPYRVCALCAHRLHTMSLRPLDAYAERDNVPDTRRWVQALWSLWTGNS